MAVPTEAPQSGTDVEGPHPEFRPMFGPPPILAVDPLQLRTVHSEHSNSGSLVGLTGSDEVNPTSPNNIRGNIPNPTPTSGAEKRIQIPWNWI
jgi:hypothetical protein